MALHRILAMHLLRTLLFGAILMPAVAQQIALHDWRTLSSLYQTRESDVDSSGNVWVATSGGVASLDTSTKQVTVFTNVNGLQTLDCTALYCDRVSNRVYVGQNDGSLDIRQADGSWMHVFDIKRATIYPRRAILAFSQRGDTLAMATEFGIVLYNTKSDLFIETIDRIGGFAEKTRVQSIAFTGESLWAIVGGKVCNAPLSATTLRLPSVWTNRSSNTGLPDSTDPVLFLAARNGSVLVATSRTVYSWNDNSFAQRFTALDDIKGLTITANGSVYVSTYKAVFKDGVAMSITWPASIDGHASFGDKPTNQSSIIVVHLKDLGFGYIADGRLTIAGINSPSSNQFADMSIDTQGWLWVATHTDGGYGGQGVCYFDGSTWRSINTSNQPLLQSNGCYRVSSLADGSTWIGTWGRGALRCSHTNTGIDAVRYDRSNSSLNGIAADSNYILVSEVVLDKYNRTIALNEQSADRLFTVLAPSGIWSYRQNCSYSRDNLYRSLAVDGNGTVWCASPDSKGLLGYNDKNTESMDDDVCNKILQSNSQLQDNVVTSLKVDQQGSLWIGTAKGLAVISTPWSLSNTSIPYVRRVSAMSTSYINDVFVDALNNKWVATPNGVFVLDESGIEVLATITTATAPLLDDNVRTIVLDENTGLAYFGTLKGCSVASTSSMRPLPSFDVTCYPQPFHPSTQTHVVIDGLAPDAEIRILTTGGIFVNALQTRGRQALWNGLDASGNTVPPGVYIASISSASTGTSAVAKIAVGR